MAVAHSLLLESLYAVSDTIISDKHNLIDLTFLSNTIPSRIIKEGIVADFIEYIDTYISNDFLIWENQVGSTYPQWKKSTADIIHSLKDDLRALNYENKLLRGALDSHLSSPRTYQQRFIDNNAFVVALVHLVFN